MPKINRDSFIFCLEKSETEVELSDILDWLSRYSDVKITYEENNPQNCA
jgi:hypothetical protein